MDPCLFHPDTADDEKVRNYSFDQSKTTGSSFDDTNSSFYNLTNDNCFEHTINDTNTSSLDESLSTNTATTSAIVYVCTVCTVNICHYGSRPSDGANIRDLVTSNASTYVVCTVCTVNICQYR